MSRTLRLKISGLGDVSRVEALERSLGLVAGVQGVVVDPERGEVLVNGDPDEHLVVVHLANEGFEAQSRPRACPAPAGGPTGLGALHWKREPPNGRKPDQERLQQRRRRGQRCCWQPGRGHKRPDWRQSRAGRRAGSGRPTVPANVRPAKGRPSWVPN